jgi:DNA-binding XRE family transcriptional regulator
MDLKLTKEEDLVEAAVELCTMRVVKKISKKNMDELYSINAHTMNNIEKGKSVPLLQYMNYVRAVGGEIIIRLPNEKEKGKDKK